MILLKVTLECSDGFDEPYTEVLNMFTDVDVKCMYQLFTLPLDLEYLIKYRASVSSAKVSIHFFPHSPFLEKHLVQTDLTSLINLASIPMNSELLKEFQEYYKAGILDVPTALITFFKEKGIPYQPIPVETFRCNKDLIWCILEINANRDIVC
jgi:hypothetical protein